jgi:DNA-binding winged helix-turn-helix (wHTH) protein/Tfp pilus assembly protein PilF
MAAYAFGPFILDVGERRLTRDGQRVPVAGKTLQILQLLVEARGHLVERETFQQRLWPEVTVEERNLTVHVSTLRRALGSGASPLGYIETVARAGYRITVPVRVLPPAETPRPVDLAPPARTAWPLAVLPFSTHGLPEADAYLGAGIADAVITQLGGLAGLAVRSTGVTRDVGAARDAVEVGRALQVGHVLEGTVQRDAERLRVSTQLVEVASGATQWSERFEQPVDSGFALQDAIAARVADWITPQFSPAEHAALRSYRPQPSEAYFLQLQARAQLNQAERVPALKALALFERALALDPNYPAAHAGLASAYLLLTSTMIRRPLPVDEAVQLARESAQRALALDERLGEAWAVLGRLKMFYEWDWHGAEADLAHAVALSPNSVEAVEAHGWFLCAAGRPDEALEALARARRLDPLRRETIEHQGLAYWMAGESDRAVATLADASAVDPEARRPHFRRMVVLDQLGRSDEAMAARAVWLKLFGEPETAQRLTELGRNGSWRAAMVDWIAMLERLNQWYEAALQWMAIDEPAAALAALERCVAERGTNLPFLLQYPSFQPLHGEARFRRLARELGLDGGG